MALLHTLFSNIRKTARDRKRGRGRGQPSGIDAAQVQAAPAARPVAFHNYWDATARNGHRAVHQQVLGDASITHTEWSRRELMSVSRKLFDNDGIIRGAVKALADDGLPLIPQAATNDRQWNKAANDYFRNWARRHADIKGEDNFGDIQAAASRDVDRDGDTLIVLTQHPSGIPALQVIEAHRIDSSGLEGERWKEGLRRNRQGRVTHYAVTEADREKPRIIPARSALLLKDTDRVTQNRGIPASKTALVHIQDKREILGFEKLTVKNLSSILPWIETESGVVDATKFNIGQPDGIATTETDPPSSTSPPGTINAGSPLDPSQMSTQQIHGGEAPVLKTGQKLQHHDFNRPSQTFQGFLEFLLREFAIGLGIPYEYLIDPKGITGPGHRSVLGRVQRKIRKRQRLIAKLVERVWAHVIAYAIDSGDLPPMEGWHTCTLLLPAKLTIDNGRESREEREDVFAGLMTLEEHFGNRSQDWQTALDQIVREQAAILAAAKTLADETGLPLQTCLDRISKITPNGSLLENIAATANSNTAEE